MRACKTGTSMGATPHEGLKQVSVPRLTKEPGPAQSNRMADATDRELRWRLT